MLSFPEGYPKYHFQSHIIPIIHMPKVKENKVEKKKTRSFPVPEGRKVNVVVPHNPGMSAVVPPVSLSPKKRHLAVVCLSYQKKNAKVKKC